MSLRSLIAPFAVECNCHEVVVQDPYLCTLLRSAPQAAAFERCGQDEALALCARPS